MFGRNTTWVVGLIAVLTVAVVAAAAGPGDADARPGGQMLKKQLTPQKKPIVKLVPSGPVTKVRKNRGPFRSCQLKAGDEKPGKCIVVKGPKDRKIIAFGDSKVGHWSAALKQFAIKRNYRLIWLLKSGCGPAPIRASNHRLPDFEEWEECYRWRERAYKRIERVQPQIVITGTTNGYAPLDDEGQPITDLTERQEHLRDRLAEGLERMKAASGKVLLIEDVPGPGRSGVDVPRCVRNKPKKFDRCGFDPLKTINNAIPYPLMRFDVPAAEAVPGVEVVRTRDFVCPDDYCRAVIGDVIVWRDKTHITARYARSLWPRIDRRIRNALNRAGNDS